MAPLPPLHIPLSMPFLKISSENIKKCKNLRLFGAVIFAIVANRDVGNFVRFDFWSGGGVHSPLKKGKSRAKCGATGVFDVWLQLIA